MPKGIQYGDTASPYIIFKNMKKKYIKPLTEVIKIKGKPSINNSSVEYYKEYIESPSDWGDSIITNPDDEIIW